jgi:hypothetical protein
MPGNGSSREYGDTGEVIPSFPLRCLGARWMAIEELAWEVAAATALADAPMVPDAPRPEEDWTNTSP